MTEISLIVTLNNKFNSTQLIFLMENIYTYVQFEGMIYQQIVGIPMGTNCAPLIADLLSSRNSVGADIVTRPFVGGWVSK